MDLAAVAAARALHLIGTAVATVLIAQQLPAEQAGPALHALAVALVLGSAGELGLARTLLRRVAEALSQDRPEVAARWLRAGLLAALGVGLLGGGLWAGLLLATGLRALALPTAALAAAWTVLAAVVAALKGLDRPGLAVTFSHTLFPLVQVASLALGRDTAAPVLVGLWAAGAWLLAAAGLVAAWRIAGQPDGQILGEIRPLLRQAAPAWWLGLSATALTQLDVAVVGLVLPPAEVTAYAVASRLAAGVTLGQTLFQQASGAWVVRLVTLRQPGELQALLARGARWATLLAVVAWLVGLGLAGMGLMGLGLVGRWLPHAFGPDLALGTAVFAVLGLRQVLACALGPAEHVLQLVGDLGPLARLSGLGLGLLAVGTGVGAAAGGAVGAAVVGSAAVVLYKALAALTTYRHLGVRTDLAAGRK